jgi:hypothetical protein
MCAHSNIFSLLRVLKALLEPWRTFQELWKSFEVFVRNTIRF